MAAVRQVHPHDRVARLEDGEVDGHVGLRAGVRLHICVLGAEELFGALDGDGLDDVRRSAAAVVAFSGIPLGVLVREDGAHGREHGRRNVVLRGDELERVVLALRLAADGGRDLRIDLGERSVEESVPHRGRLLLFFVNRRHVSLLQKAILQ